VKPFLVSEAGRTIVDQYPHAESLRLTFQRMTASETDGALRFWFTEGVPFAFKHSPILYEIVRGWLGSELGVHPKLVTMVGSGRLGFAFDPASYGRPFSEHSDLDITVISEALFPRLAQLFYAWMNDIATNSVHARHAQEELLWTENLKVIQKTLGRGFIDENKLPARDRYPLVQHIRQRMFLLKEKLAISKSGFVVTGASIRIYRDWPSFFKQTKRNLEAVLSTPLVPRRESQS
jgi:hypothetical protein